MLFQVLKYHGLFSNSKNSVMGWNKVCIAKHMLQYCVNDNIRAMYWQEDGVCCVPDNCKLCAQHLAEIAA